jgi:hypothetical protein
MISSLSVGDGIHGETVHETAGRLKKSGKIYFCWASLDFQIRRNGPLVL